MKTTKGALLSQVMGVNKVLESPVAKYIHIKTPNVPVISNHNFEEEEENLVQELLNSLLLTNDTYLLDFKVPVSYKVHNKLYEEVIIIGQQQVYIYNNHFINLKLHDSLRRMSATLIQLEVSQCNLDNSSELICSQGNYLQMCRSLRYLNLSRNNLTDIPSCMIELNRNLQFLNLSGNKIGQFNADKLLRNLHELIPSSVLVLHLSGNPVHTLTSSVSYRSSVINAFPLLYILDGYLLLYREKYQHLNYLFTNHSFNYFLSDIKLPMHVYHIAFSHSVYNNNNNRMGDVLKMCQNISNRVNPIFMIHNICKKYLANNRYKVFTSNRVIEKFQSCCRSYILKSRLRYEMKSILHEQQQEHLLAYASGSLSLGILLKILHKFVSRGLVRWRRRKSAIKIQLWYKKLYYKVHHEREYYQNHNYHGVCVPTFHYDEALEILHDVVQRYNKKQSINLAVNVDNLVSHSNSENITVRKLEHVGLCKLMIKCKSQIARNYRYIPHRLSNFDQNHKSVASIDSIVKYADLIQWKQFTTLKRVPHRVKREHYQFVKNGPLMRSLDKFKDAAIPLYLIQIPDQILLQDYFRYLTQKQMLYVYHDQYVFRNIAAAIIQKRFRNTILRKQMSYVLIPILLKNRSIIAIQRAWRFYRTVIRRLDFHRAVHIQVSDISSATLFMDSWFYYIAIRIKHLLPVNINCYPEFTGVPVITVEGKAAFYSFHSNNVTDSRVVVPLPQVSGNTDCANPSSGEIDTNKLQQMYDDMSLGEEYISKRFSNNRAGFPLWLCLTLPLANNCETMTNRTTYSYGIYDMLTTDVDVKLVPLQLDDHGSVYNVIKLQFSSIAEAKARCASLMLLSYSFYNYTSLKLLTEKQINSYLSDKKDEILSMIHAANPLQCIESCINLERDAPHLIKSYFTSSQDYIRFRYMVECMKAEQFNQNIADEELKREFILVEQVESYTKTAPRAHVMDTSTRHSDSTSLDITQVGYQPVFDEFTRGSSKRYSQSQCDINENTFNGNNNEVDGDGERVACNNKPETLNGNDRHEVENILLEIVLLVENNDLVSISREDNNSISIISMREYSLEDSQVGNETHLVSNIINESVVLSLGSSTRTRQGSGKKRPHTTPNRRRPITPLASDNVIRNRTENNRVSTPVNYRSIRTSSLWSSKRLLYWCSRNQVSDQGIAGRLELLQYNMNRATSPLRPVTPSMKDNKTSAKCDILNVDTSYNSASCIILAPSNKSYFHLYLNKGSATNNIELLSDNMHPSSPVTPNPYINTPKQSWKERLFDEKKRSVEGYMHMESTLMNEYYLKKELDLVLKQKHVQNTRSINIKATIPITAPITLPFSIPLYITPETQVLNATKEEYNAYFSNHNTAKRESIIDLKNKKIIKQKEKEAADLVASFMKHSNKANISLAKKYYNKKVKHVASKNKAKNVTHMTDILTNLSVPDTHLTEQSSELLKIHNVTLSNYGILTGSSTLNDSIISDETFVKFPNKPVYIENNLFKPVYMNDELSITRGVRETMPSPPTKSLPTRQKLRSSYGKKRPNTSHMTPPVTIQRQYAPSPVDRNVATYSIVSEPTESIWKEVAKEDRDHYRKLANDSNVARNKKCKEKIIQIPVVSYKF